MDRHPDRDADLHHHAQRVRVALTAPDLSWWLAIKNSLAATLQLDRDALHIYLALAIMLVTAGVTRWRLDQWRVLLPLLVLALANEAIDLLHESWPGTDRARQWGESVRDMANTLAAPILLMMIIRRIRPSGSPPAG